MAESSDSERSRSGDSDQVADDYDYHDWEKIALEQMATTNEVSEDMLAQASGKNWLSKWTQRLRSMCTERCELPERPPLRRCVRYCTKEDGHDGAHNCRMPHQWLEPQICGEQCELYEGQPPRRCTRTCNKPQGCAGVHNCRLPHDWGNHTMVAAEVVIQLQDQMQNRVATGERLQHAAGQTMLHLRKMEGYRNCCSVLKKKG